MCGGSPRLLVFYFYFCFLLVVKDVGEIHRREDVLTLILPSLNRSMCGEAMFV